MTSSQKNSGPKGTGVHIYNPQYWIIRLINGTTLFGSVQDDSDNMIVLDNPMVLQTPRPVFDSFRTRLDTHDYLAEERIYIERTAIAYWAKPKDTIL